MHTVRCSRVHLYLYTRVQVQAWTFFYIGNCTVNKYKNTCLLWSDMFKHTGWTIRRPDNYADIWLSWQKRRWGRRVGGLSSGDFMVENCRWTLIRRDGWKLWMSGMGLLKVWCNWRENNRHNGGSLSLIQEAAGLVLLGKITNLGRKKQSVNLTL